MKSSHLVPEPSLIGEELVDAGNEIAVGMANTLITKGGRVGSYVLLR